MDWLTFIANVVQSISWPASAFMIALIFRTQITALFNNLSRLKWRDVEAEFGEKVEQIRADIRSIEEDPNYTDEPIEPALVDLIDSHPHLAVLEGWKRLENEIIQKSMARLHAERLLPLTSHVDGLVAAGLIPVAMAKAIRDIQSVRNRAVHEVDASVSKGHAYFILDTIADIVGYLKKLN